MAFAIKCRTFGDMISIVENRAKIAGGVQDSNRDLIKAALNEYNIQIGTERPWRWRKQDRAFNFNQAIKTGTVSVTQDSRAITFTGFNVLKVHLGRSIKVDGFPEIYRIIGVSEGLNAAYLDASFVGTTNAAATYKLFHYEFPLPPDVDTLDQVHVDTGGVIWSDSNSGELDAWNVLEFNRALSNQIDYTGVPIAYTRDSDQFFNSMPPLDVMVLNYDFLGGDISDKTDRIRIFPIEPDARRVIHINYSRQVTAMSEDDHEPLMPLDDRWVLIHFALAEWHAFNGSGDMADREFRRGEKKLKEMRSEHHKTDTAPRFRVNGSQYIRTHMYPDNRDKFLQARLKENI